MSTVIKVESLSKQYRLGLVGTGTLSHDLNRWWHRIRGKEDPYLKVGEVNDRSSRGGSDYVWALRDINFEVQQGEVLGIIGKNGAGKSTLLKIMSKVTGPTTGRIMAKGRIASLLEVGTGFHPELTGRENIYLNGTILGMTKREVDRKLDEIVDFAGVARYIDTPAKRYSSGMMVRLGFAVAAHLEPEILIVDEVLAVGDAEFQKKAIGKMQEVSHEGGRTVLFVSHNMAAVRSLCDRGLVLEDGSQVFLGDALKAVNLYLSDTGSRTSKRHEIPYDNNHIVIESVKASLWENRREEVIAYEDDIAVTIQYELPETRYRVDFTFQIKDDTGAYIFTTSTGQYEPVVPKGENTAVLRIPGRFFNWGTFSIDILIVENRSHVLQRINDISEFTIQPAKLEIGRWMGRTLGPMRPALDWSFE